MTDPTPWTPPVLPDPAAPVPGPAGDAAPPVDAVPAPPLTAPPITVEPPADVAPLPVPDPTPAPTSPTLVRGMLVAHTFFDPYSGAGGQEITLDGLVTHVEPDGSARVAWLVSSDPIPASELSPL